jgi:cytochrome c oxidase assembly protein subunit 15
MASTLPSNRPLIVWLLSTCFLIWLMIMLGGATRLTHAGLSIVEWKPITGIIPPLSHTQWIVEFEKYQQFPEYKLINQGISLASFQFIYFMEYAHRLLGRLMGLWFMLPLLYFWKRNQLSFKLKKVAMIALMLGLAQGIMGWYMVKSGLVNDPSVSHYRLTAHLGLAIALYGLLFWTAVELMCAPFRSLAKTEPAILGQFALTSCIAVCLTILYGGLVAGLKAGLIYNTFPLMDGQFIPSEWSFYKPLWLNFFENAALVQWMHRWIAATTIVLVLYTSWKTWNLSSHEHTRKIAVLLGIAAFAQGTLGVFTLLLQVPVCLGTLHQGTAVVVLSLGLYLLYLTKPNFGLGRGSDFV